MGTQPKVFDEPLIKQHSCVESQPQVSTVLPPPEALDPVEALP
jgi:hypothetical protein